MSHCACVRELGGESAILKTVSSSSSTCNCKLETMRFYGFHSFSFNKVKKTSFKQPKPSSSRSQNQTKIIFQPIQQKAAYKIHPKHLKKKQRREKETEETSSSCIMEMSLVHQIISLRLETRFKPNQTIGTPLHNIHKDSQN